MKDLRGRNALITGASYGIGSLIAKELAQEGVNLALVARSTDKLQQVAEGLKSFGVKVITIVADLAQASGRDTAVETAEKQLGPIDILVNNASGHAGGPLDSRTAEDVEEIMQINLVAPIELTRRVLPGMLQRGRGHLVHLASLVGKAPMPFFTLYTSSKYGLVGFNQCLQSELAGTGVYSSCICPGSVRSQGMWDRLEHGYHFALGATKPEKVVRAVRTALLRNKIELVVNPMPVRPVLFLWALMPGVGQFVYRLLGLDRFFREASQKAFKMGPPKPSALKPVPEARVAG
jgi:short-subunit dehydrogenase